MSDFMDQVNELRRKDKNDVTEEELAFLKARRSYLTVDERKYFGVEEQVAQEATQEASEEPVVPKKTKK